jgi:ACS family hexuronate transporter-like MFS transporter
MSDTSPNAWRWWVCGAMMFATLLNYMDRQVLPQIGTELKDSWGIDDARYGQVAGNFARAFALGSIFFGLIADRIGPRLLYPFVLIGWSTAGLATPLMTDPAWSSRVANPDDPASGPFEWLLLCRTVLGFFEAGHWPCALLTARQILTSKDRPLGNGLLQSGASLGAIFVPLYVMAVRNLGGGWEIAFWTIGGFGLLWVPAWLLLVRRGDLIHPVELPPSGLSASGSFDIRRFLRVYTALFAIIMGISVSWQFIREWLPKYLKESQGYTKDETDLIVPVYYISAEIGCLVAGLFVRWLVARGLTVHGARIAGYAVFAVVTAAAAAAPFAPRDIGTGLLVFAGAGILALHPYYYAFVQELPAKHMAMLSGALAAVSWFVVGAVQEAMGNHIKATGQYDTGFILAGLAPLAGFVTLMLLWRKDDSLREVTAAH